jgi:hypothetical protein
MAVRSILPLIKSNPKKIATAIPVRVSSHPNTCDAMLMTIGPTRLWASAGPWKVLTPFDRAADPSA